MKQISTVIFIAGFISILYSQQNLERVIEKCEASINFTQFSNPGSESESIFNMTIMNMVYADRDTVLMKLKTFGLKDDICHYTLSDTIIYSGSTFISVCCYSGYHLEGVPLSSLHLFSINYDLEKNKELFLNDFYSEGYLQVLSDYCINELLKQKIIYYPDVTKENKLFTEWAGADEKNFRAFNPAKDGLHISFVTYNMGKGVVRLPDYSIVVVPYSVLKNYLKPDTKLKLFIN